MEERKLRIAITHGDTNGIGYETIFKAFADPAMLELCTPIIYGSPKIAAYHRKTLDLQVNFNIINQASEARDDKFNLLTSFDEEVKVDLGTSTPISATAARVALKRALDDFNKGLFDVLVTAPVATNPVDNDDTATVSTRQQIEHQLGHDGKSLSIHVNGDLRIASITNEIPLGDALREIRKDLIVEKATVLNECLRRDFRLSNPRIALLQVNPQEGAEEEEIIKPAINELHNTGVGVYGPYPADEFFSRYDHLHFDATLAMFYEQAMIPLRMLADNDRVVVSAGLPLVHTTPGQTPQFDIAGQGIANEQQLRDAIYLAIDIFRHRAEYDEPLSNPLKKLYHEKRDDSEKVRFTIPKKHDQNA